MNPYIFYSMKLIQEQPAADGGREWCSAADHSGDGHPAAASHLHLHRNQRRQWRHVHRLREPHCHRRSVAQLMSFL